MGNSKNDLSGTDTQVIRTFTAMDCGGKCLLKVHVKDGKVTHIEGDDAEAGSRALAEDGDGTIDDFDEMVGADGSHGVRWNGPRGEIHELVPQAYRLEAEVEGLGGFTPGCGIQFEFHGRL